MGQSMGGHPWGKDGMPACMGCLWASRGSAHSQLRVVTEAAWAVPPPPAPPGGLKAEQPPPHSPKAFLGCTRRRVKG